MFLFFPLAGVTKSAELSLTDQTLQAIEDCISRTPSQWSDEWKQQYLETIRKAVDLHRHVPVTIVHGFFLDGKAVNLV